MFPSRGIPEAMTPKIVFPLPFFSKSSFVASPHFLAHPSFSLKRCCRWIIVLILYAFLVGVVFPYSALGNAESFNFVERGAQDLQSGNFESALQVFEKAESVNPADSQAVFFQGVALNRLGKSSQAFGRLQRARQMGVLHPDLAFELGWSFLHLKRFVEAVVELESYEKTSPGRGQTSEFLGRAHYAIGNYDLADHFLLQAIQRDPSLVVTSRLFLALVAKARGDDESIASYLNSMVEDSPDSPLSRRIQEQVELQGGVGRAGSSAFRLQVSAIGGYNDNVVALGKGVNLPADISSKDANFFQSSLDASYALGLTEEDTFIAGYRFLSTVYPSLSSFDLIDHFIYLDLRHAFHPNLTGTIRVSDEFTQVGGNNFRNQVGVRPALAWRMFDWNIVELAYAFFSGDYLLPTTAVFNRDSATNTISVTDFFRIPGWPVQGRLGYFHVWNDADGADFDSETDGLVFGLTAYLLPQLTGDVFYARTWDHYVSLNSLSGPTGFAFRRIDGVDRVTTQFTWEFVEWLKAYVRYDHVSADSNIIFFDFAQNSYSGGFVVLLQ